MLAAVGQTAAVFYRKIVYVAMSSLLDQSRLIFWKRTHISQRGDAENARHENARRKNAAQ